MPVKKSNDPKTILQNELKKLIKKIDEDGLMYLVEQANTLVFNLEIDKKNAVIESINNKLVKTKKSKVTKTTKETTHIELHADDDKKTFILEIGGFRKFMTRDEIKIMVRISHLVESEQSKCASLFTWLYKERRDVLMDGGIRTKTDPKLNFIIKMLQSKYKTK